MKYQKVIIFTLAIIIIGVSLYVAISKRENLFSLTKSVPTQVEQTTWQTQTLTDGTVTYKATPKDLTLGETTWDFEMAIDTHAGSLDQDLVTLVSIVDDKGNEYKAIKWEGDPPGGHHREGILKFSPITPRPTFLELEIETSGDAKETSLRWNI